MRKDFPSAESDLTKELLKAIVVIGSDVRWRERLDEYFRENAPGIWNVSPWQVNETQTINAINDASKALSKQTDADTVALWRKRLKALKAEFAEELQRRKDAPMEQLMRDIESRNAKIEAAQAQRESKLSYRIERWIDRWIFWIRRP